MRGSRVVDPLHLTFRMVETSSSPAFRPSPDVVFRRVGEEAVLVPLRQNVGNLEWVYTLSPVAARVWQLLDGRRPVGELVTAVCEEYDVQETEAATDVAELLGALRDAGLIVETA